MLQRAAAHVQSAGKDEIDGRNVLVAIFREPDSHAAYLLEQQGVTRLDVVSYISHGVSKIAEEGGLADSESAEDEDDEDERRRAGAAGRRIRSRSSPSTWWRVPPRARSIPLIGRDDELARTIHVLCRRRKNNPLFVGEPASARRRSPKASRCTSTRARCPTR